MIFYIYTYIHIYLFMIYIYIYMCVCVYYGSYLFREQDAVGVHFLIVFGKL